MLRILLASSKARRRVTTLASMTAWTWRWRRGERRPHPRDYRDAGSVNGLLALWGFVDDTTFLTKAGHVGVVYAVRGVDYEGLSHPQRQALAHRFEAALRLLDEHCRVYQYLLKRTVGPFVAAACQPPIANEAIQRRAATERSTRGLYDLALSGPALRSAARRAEQHSCGTSGRRTSGAAGWLSPDQRFAAGRIGVGPSHRDATTRRRRSRCRSESLDRRVSRSRTPSASSGSW